MVRHAVEAPVVALTVMVLLPTSRGICSADQFVVPAAIPAAPPDVDQETVAMEAGAAVPLKSIVAALVETEVAAGDVITIDGGV